MATARRERSADRRAPHALPADVPLFTGRDAELAGLESARTGADAARVVVIAGMPGVGKTATAVHWAHRIAADYPDGSLYVDLRGSSTGPALPAAEALGSLLRSLGVGAGRIPAEAEAAATLYRAETAGRRLLVLLDDAASAEQALPLVPGGTGSLAIVTGRDRLDGLAGPTGAGLTRLGPLAPGESRLLLKRVLNRPDRPSEAEIADLADRCGHLPLALRLAAAGLDGTEQPGPGGHDERPPRPAEDPPAAREAFERSYAALPEPDRTVFRLLGAAPVRSLTAEAVAAMTGAAGDTVRRGLDRLADADLVGRDGRGRFSLHDPVRAYAVELNDRAHDRDRAVARLMDWYVDAATVATGLRYTERMAPFDHGPPERPVGLANADQAGRWLTEERGNLLAIARHAADHAADGGTGAVAWKLAGLLRGHAWSEYSGPDALALGQAALAGALADGSLEGEAVAELSLSTAYSRTRRFEETVTHAERAAALARRIAWTPGLASSLQNLTFAAWHLGRLRDAQRHGEEALAMNRADGRTRAQSVNLGTLANVAWARGDLRHAMLLHAEGLEIAERIGNPRLRSSHCRAIAAVAIELGEVDRAGRYADRARRAEAETGPDSVVTRPAVVDVDLALAAGDGEGALARAERVVRSAEERGDRSTESTARTKAAAALNRLGRHREAQAAAARALRAAGAELVGARIDALLEQAVARIGNGETAIAIAGARRALDLAVDGGHGTREALALTAVAEAELRGGRIGEGARAARRAEGLLRASGHVPGRAWALWVLGRCAAEAGDGAAACVRWAEVRRLHERMGVPVPPRYRMDAGPGAA